MGDGLMADPRVADLTVDEFKGLMREIVAQTILEMLSDPDDGLELREDMKERLQHSLADVHAGDKMAPAQEVAEKLGLTW
jgi:hypothetical protein